MKHEKPQLTSGETSLLPETTTENTTTATQRKNPPGLATALFNWMVTPGTPFSRGLERINTGRLRFESLKKKVPPRLIVAIFLLIAAVITGFFAPQPL